MTKKNWPIVPCMVPGTMATVSVKSRFFTFECKKYKALTRFSKFTKHW